MGTQQQQVHCGFYTELYDFDQIFFPGEVCCPSSLECVEVKQEPNKIESINHDKDRFTRFIDETQCENHLNDTGTDYYHNPTDTDGDTDCSDHVGEKGGNHSWAKHVWEAKQRATKEDGVKRKYVLCDDSDTYVNDSDAATDCEMFHEIPRELKLVSHVSLTPTRE